MPSNPSRKAMVVGGSRGIGAAIVSSLADADMEVTFTYVTSDEKAEELSRSTGAKALKLDAAATSSWDAIGEQAGALDVFVYNAGIAIQGDPLEIDRAVIDRMIDINLRGAYHSSVAAARHMREGGRIILIGSTNGDSTLFPGITGYAMTKSALQGLARGLARDFGPRGITVNVVQPGPTDTDMNPADGPMVDEYHAMMALKRHGTAAEVASLVRYLTTDGARGITGATLSVDGGYGV